MKLQEIAKKINSKEDFLYFLEALLNDYKNNVKEWENKTLVDYLEALHACVEDMEGFYLHKNSELPDSIPWFIFSDALMSARIYE